MTHTKEPWMEPPGGGMSDLVKRLRKQVHDARLTAEPPECAPVVDLDDAAEAADRIEALERERDGLFRRATLAEQWRDHDYDRVQALEEALREAIRRAYNPFEPDNQVPEYHSWKALLNGAALNDKEVT